MKIQALTNAQRRRYERIAEVLNGGLENYPGELARYKNDTAPTNSRLKVVQFLWRDSEREPWKASPDFKTRGTVTSDFIVTSWESFVDGLVMMEPGSDIPRTEPLQIRIIRKG